jgi:hypothetical protein
MAEDGSDRVTRLGVSLCARDTGSEVGRYALPTHTPERLIAETHLCAVAAGALPNDGRPIERARVTLNGEVGGEGASPALDVGVSVGDARFHKRFVADSVADDAQVLVSRLSRAGTIPAGLYHYSLTEVEPEGEAAAGLRLRPFPRALPLLPEISLEEAGLELPRCPHPAIFLPASEARRLLAQAAATPQIEVGALLRVTPFLIAEPVPHRLGVYVREATPLEEGTAGDALHVRITPAALAGVPVDEAQGLLRGGLAHSHPAGAKTEQAVAKGVTLFLSPDDVAFATSFFWQPFQFQVVIDAREHEPERALGVFCWVEGRLVRVCFRILEEEPVAWGETTT